jgi:hypothetical protein
MLELFRLNCSNVDNGYISLNMQGSPSPSANKNNFCINVLRGSYAKLIYP